MTLGHTGEPGYFTVNKSIAETETYQIKKYPRHFRLRDGPVNHERTRSHTKRTTAKD